VTDLRLRRDVTWNLAPVVLLAVVGLGMNFAIAAWWDAEALAVFNLVTTAFFVLAVIGACGLQFAVLRAVAEAPDDPGRVAPIVVGALVPAVVLAAAATALFVALRGPISALHHSAAVGEGMLYAAPGLFCFALNKVLFGVVNGLRRMRAYAIYTSLRYVAMAGGLGIARATDVAAAHLPVIWTISEGVVFVVLIGELVATVPLARAAGWRTWTRLHLDYGARGVTATLAYEINTKLDVWMLGASSLPKQLVGVYALAGALYEGATQLAVVVQTNLNPVMARSLAAGNPGEVTQLVRRTRRWFVPGFALACLLGAALFPAVIPWLTAKPEFHAGAAPFAVLMLGLVLASPYLPFLQFMLMANRPGWHAVLIVAVLAINFAGQLAWIPLLGLPGAAIGTCTSVVASALLVRAIARRVVRVQL
jgi:O-antigen/teichoic acid export membrane protein